MQTEIGHKSKKQNKKSKCTKISFVKQKYQ